MISVAGAIRENCQTAGTNKKAVEVELQKWFGNARDRGSDSRKKIRRPQNRENSTPDQE
jgi:hypothetical protein